MNKLIPLCLVVLLLQTSCASAAYPERTTSQQIIYGANVLLYTPLCLLYGVCPDIADDD